MERPESRSSGVPRVSKLPQTRLAQPAQSTLPTANTGIVRPPRRNTVETEDAAGAAVAGLRSPSPITSPVGKRHTMLTRPGFTTGIKSPERASVTSPPPTGLQRPQSSVGRYGAVAQDAPRLRGPPPSLTDRATDTLSRVPPSPVGRRSSAFYGTDSPLKVQPPSRAESALGHRPSSRVGAVSSNRAPGQSPASPTKRPSERGFAGPASIAQSKRVPPTKPTPSKPATSLRSPIKSPKASTSFGTLSTPSRNSTAVPKTHSKTLSQESSDVPAAKTSFALRNAIAQAKAVHKSAGPTGAALVPRAAAGSNIANFGPDADPNMMDFVDSAHVNILRKRIANAHTDGKLNIGSLCLSEIPIEVLNLHQGESDVPWYERVDVTRVIAPDNELKELPLEMFPPMSLEEEPDNPGPFPSLQYLDLHSNQLESLPDTIIYLPTLEILVLSNNHLTAKIWGILFSIPSLRRLEIGKNKLEGSIPSTISELVKLEYLDVHDNSVSDISGSIANLTTLKHMNVSGNELPALPLEGLFDLPLATINASSNKLSGSLFPKTVPTFEALVELDVSYNSLGFFAEAGVKLPKLRRLNCSHNRIMELPDVSAWTDLEELNAEENKISALPTGFAKLKSLSVANFCNNSILTLDREIGFMDRLVKLDITFNPLRQRGLLKLNTDEIKAELRSLHAEPKEKEAFVPGRKFSGGSHIIAMTSTLWTVSSGTVDRSNTRMISIDSSNIEGISDQDVKTLILHHNNLQVFPPAIEMLGASLTSLDLANNKLGKSTFLSAALCLPNLTTLNLTSNALTSLDPLTTHLSAERLATLIVPFNRLTSLPALTTAFKALKKLMVSNNKITALDVESVRGLEVLDISSNDLDALPPQLGLLQGQLRTLMVNANKFRVPGWGVLEKGTDEILKWCKNRLPVESAAEKAKTPAAEETPENANTVENAKSLDTAQADGVEAKEGDTPQVKGQSKAAEEYNGRFWEMAN